IYTSTITVGNSFNKVHFDRAYLYATPQTVAPRLELQALGRVRQLASGEVVVFIQNRRNAVPQPTDYASCEQEILRRNNLVLQTENELRVRHKELRPNVEWNGARDEWKLADPAFGPLFVYRLMEHNDMTNDYVRSFLARCRYLEWPVQAHCLDSCSYCSK